jgi:hypothetical protein
VTAASPSSRDARAVAAKAVRPAVAAEKMEKVVKKAKVEMTGKGTPQSVLPGSRPTGIVTKPKPNPIPASIPVVCALLV